MKSVSQVEALIDDIRNEYLEARKQASLSRAASTLSPVDAAGRLIREERKKQGLSQQELCDLSGVAYATLSKMEHGHSSMRLHSLQKVLNALGLKLWIG